jgi:hypothetical protein
VSKEKVVLDRSKLLGALTKCQEFLFTDTLQDRMRAQHAWETVCVTPEFAQRLSISEPDWPVASWDGNLLEIQSINRDKQSYHVIAVDGSQIYPDRHQGTVCSLINIGLVELSYRCVHAGFQFNSEPYLVTEYKDGQEKFTEYINNQRHELELQTGIQRAFKRKQECSFGEKEFIIVLCDGSLIFWYIQSHDNQLLVSQELEKSLALLALSYEERIPIASYISAPSSCELVGLVRFALCSIEGPHKAAQTVDQLLDIHVVAFYLKPYQATRWFKNQSQVTQHYPEHLHPYFAYIHVGAEIARIEAPAWVAHNTLYSSFVLYTALDQAIKGNGYPVCLAEAHEQAVIKAPDREFFYNTLATIAYKRGMNIGLSRKQINKQVMGI